MDRRAFLCQSKTAAVGLGAGMTILANAQSVRGAPAAEKIQLAVIGIRGRGQQLAQGFLERDDCEIAYLCDVNSALFASRADAIEDLQGRRPQCVQDFRRTLDDAAVDAVVIATPDHWHAPATIWACQAGKDVYVEKPASHSCWEGQKMVEAARKYQRIVQVGTQNRSAPYNMEAKKLIESGGLGRIHLCRVFNMKFMSNPPWDVDREPPDGYDWDMWLGPASARPYNSTIPNGGWHHLWDFSGGDLANDGVHQIDLARWLCGVELPRKVYCNGGRYHTDGSAQAPDTQVATLEYDGLLMTFEMTLYTPYMLKTDPEVRNSDMFPYWMQNATRIEIYGSDAMMIAGRHGGGWQVFIRQKDRQPVVQSQQYGRFPDPEHKEDFMRCIRTRQQPNADIEIGHRSAALVHYSNISLRVGRPLEIDPVTEHIVEDFNSREQAAAFLFRRRYRAPWVVPDTV